MNSTHSDITHEIYTKEVEDAATTRARIAERMQDYGAVLWTASVFGSTGLPMLSVSSTERHEVYGLRLDREGSLSAIIAPVHTKHPFEALALNQAEAERLISPEITMVAGTPDEWDVINACLEATLPVLEAEKKDEQPLPWW